MKATFGTKTDLYRLRQSLCATCRNSYLSRARPRNFIDPIAHSRHSYLTNANYGCIYPHMSKNPHRERPPSGLQLRNALMAVQGHISLPQLVVLLTIRIEPGLSVNDLADKLNIPQQSASRYVALLAGRYQTETEQPLFEPLVLQRISDSDPRSRALYITPAGDSMLATLAP